MREESCLAADDGLEKTKGEIGWLDESTADLKLLSGRCLKEVGVRQLKQEH